MVLLLQVDDSQVDIAQSNDSGLDQVDTQVLISSRVLMHDKAIAHYRKINAAWRSQRGWQRSTEYLDLFIN